MTLDPECIFCKIIEGQIPAEIIYRNENVVAFNDLNPQAPTHILIIPTLHAENAAMMKVQAEESNLKQVMADKLEKGNYVPNSVVETAVSVASVDAFGLILLHIWTGGISALSIPVVYEATKILEFQAIKGTLEHKAACSEFSRRLSEILLCSDQISYYGLGYFKTITGTSTIPTPLRDQIVDRKSVV